MSKIKVAVDAGHGSSTAGKRTPDGYREHWINVTTAHYLAKALERNGFAVYKSAWNDRDAKDDTDVALTTRQKNIKNAKCDISVSCHANAYGSDWNSANGVDTFYHEVSSWRGDSVALAKCVQKHLPEGTKQKDRGYKSQYLAMCDCHSMNTKASILVEIGFMTNKDEAALMKTDKFCKEQAEEICHGICDYYKKTYVKEGGKVETKTEAKPTTDKIDVFYASYVGLGWLDEVKNYGSGDDGYSGLFGKAITRIKAKASKGELEYRVRRIGDANYLPWVTQYTDYAGWNGEPLDKLQMRYKQNGKYVEYRVHTKGGAWLPWVREYGDGNEGYAGIPGQTIDGLQIRIV